MTLLRRLRCLLFRDDPGCPPPWRAEDDPVLARTWALAERYNREADEIRERRLRRERGGPSWEGLLGVERDGRGGAGDAVGG